MLTGSNLSYETLPMDSIKRDTVIKVQRTPSETNVRIYGENYLLDDAAFTQGKKTFYYKSYNILLRKIGYGVSDNFDVYFLTFPYLGLSEFRVGLGGKFKVQLTKNIAIAAKSDYYNYNSIWRNSLILTIGNFKNNASIAFNNLNEIGSGHGFESRKVFTFHGRLHMKHQLYMQFENIFYSNTNSFSILSLELHKQGYKFSIGYLLLNEVDYNESFEYQQGAVFTLLVPLAFKW